MNAPCKFSTGSALWLAAAAAALLAVPTRAAAYLDATDVAGTLQDRPVLVRDVDRALDGRISDTWRDLFGVMSSGARALCRARAQERIASARAMTVTAWRATVWTETTVSDADTEHYLSQRPPSVVGADEARAAARHALHVERYRERVVREADLAIGDTYSFNLVAPAATMAGEPRMPVLASACLGRQVTRDEIERFAAFPLYRVRADTVTAICSHLEGPGAAAGRCTLELPSQPLASVAARDRSHSGPADGTAAADAVDVVYFGAFRCPDCRGGWQVLERIGARYGAQVRIDVRHHFPERSLASFTDALAVECAAAQGKLFEAGDWLADRQLSAVLAAGLALDGNRYEQCIQDPATAVTVLEDTEQALRLGFVGAVPSWVVAGKARRGIPGELALRDRIDRQLDANAAGHSAHARNDAIGAR